MISLSLQEVLYFVKSNYSNFSKTKKFCKKIIFSEEFLYISISTYAFLNSI